ELCLYEYKIYGTFSDYVPELYVDMYMDLEYRKQWDSYVKELYEQECDGQKVIYWEVKYPFPLSNRDVSFPVLKCPVAFLTVVQSSPVGWRGTAWGIQISFGLEMFMHYFDNPGGMIPAFVINWAAKSGVPSFLKEMQKACANYPEYCKKSGK
ncbi:hypothetical protein scyTo_0021395, partial [Scyliorhinus torazame]|nr:hypothetical protein [Scyliorhinus torazame]